MKCPFKTIKQIKTDPYGVIVETVEFGECGEESCMAWVIEEENHPTGCLRLSKQEGLYE